jgi:hypothetical protein
VIYSESEWAWEVPCLTVPFPFVALSQQHDVWHTRSSWLLSCFAPQQLEECGSEGESWGFTAASKSQQFGLTQGFSDLFETAKQQGLFELFFQLQHPIFFTLAFFCLKSIMLCKITSKHVPTSANTAAHRRGCPAKATTSTTVFVTIDKIMLTKIVWWVHLASLTACGIFFKSFDMRLMWLVSVATADPDTPMEMPTSAVARAGASFIPSPIIIVGPTLDFKSLMTSTLSAGRSSAWISSSTPFNCHTRTIFRVMIFIT